MKKLIILTLYFFSILAYAEIHIEINPTQVTLGEPFRLTLTYEGQQGGGVPDLSALQTDFSIIGTERQVSYSVINGQAQSLNQWIITLKALKTGILTIPAIKFGTEETTPITINVDKASKSDQVPADVDQQQGIFLLTQVNEPTPYVNQQIIYTVKLFNSKRLLDGQYQGPQVDNALIIPLGETRRYETVQNNVNYGVEEQSYAVYPQKSGVMSIGSPTFTALIYDLDPQRIKVQDKPVTLTVKPIPDRYKGSDWLPAKAVRLAERYENSSQTLSQGSTLTRIVTLEGVSVPAQLLPSLKFVETDAFSVYPEKGADHNQFKNGNLVGSTEYKVTYLLNKAGKVIIPELKVRWFNTETGKDEFAVLAPRSLDITPSSVSSNNSSPPLPTKGEAEEIAPASALNATTNFSYLPWIIALVFALAWILTLIIWIWRTWLKRTSHAGRGNYKKALEALSKACVAGNPSQARDALLHWASLHWPDAPMLNLVDLTRLIEDPALKKQIQLLTHALYKRENNLLWRGDELFRAVKAIARNKNSSKTNKENNLPPINPL
ncbi:MAG: BatD family protein [Legionella sp.]|nr:BatD family protein [Legionella sp.]